MLLVRCSNLIAALSQLRDADTQALSHDFKFGPANALGVDDDGDIRAIGILGLENRSGFQPQEIADGKGMHWQIHAEEAAKLVGLLPHFFRDCDGNLFGHGKSGGHGLSLNQELRKVNLADTQFGDRAIERVDQVFFELGFAFRGQQVVGFADR